MIYRNEIYNDTDDDFPLKNIKKIVNDNDLSIGIECNHSYNSFIVNDGPYIKDDNTTLTITGNTQFIKKLDNDLSIAIDGCDNGKKLTSDLQSPIDELTDLQSQIDELTDKLNTVISKLEDFNKNIDDVKKEIASEADNDILYSNVYEYCLKIIENKFA